MAKFIRIVFRSIASSNGTISLSSAGRRYRPSSFAYPTLQDAWRSDWNAIGGDFRKAAARLQKEVVR